MALAVLGTRAQALPALLFFLAGYAAANTCAFAAVTHLRGRTEIAHYRGLAASRPLTGAALALALLSLVGIPPLAGFVGKLGLFTVAIDGAAAWLAVAAIVNTVLSLFYYLRVIGVMVLDAPAGAVAQTLGRWSGAALAILSLLVLLLGVLAPLRGWPLAPVPLLVGSAAGIARSCQVPRHAVAMQQPARAPLARPAPPSELNRNLQEHSNWTYDT